MAEGAKQFGIEWLWIHTTISDLAEQEYLPQGGMNGDPRIKAVFAEIAIAVLSEYELKRREIPVIGDTDNGK